ncbi:type I restriction enzyme, S subunit [Pseudobutyrivibrio sp. NOR37]|uniref:Restriction endonuclease subunit S n=1 Tax=Pseudobutyrivibrio xylanivorans TaxID=185007 RepID=A0A6M0LEV2_PSEXY|nr:MULTISPECIES: restriction endonuclease subunit S [Pseudobutyrivibrio]NEX00453.1 restriction endonuclease subunit S [Pseudobutyrivibrio xylanivorans]SFR59760.1 type I restriction enzyme, S subunit [Pseudobutyrivibrio sp. NOR37]
MSKVNELIKNICPDGVKYLPLLDVANVLYGYPCDAKLFNTEGKGMPLIRIRNVLDGITDTYTIETVPNEYIISAGDLLVGMDGNFHTAVWKGDKAVLCQRVCKIYSKDETELFDGYLVHVLKPLMKKIEKSKNSGTVKHLLAKDIKSIKIPVPPIEVQREIGCVLDTFTTLNTDLIAELTTELAARKKQYEYYKTQLLKENKHYKKMKLKDIVTVSMCRRIKKAETVTKGDVPFYQNGTLGGDANLYLERDVYEFYKSKSKLPKAGEVMLSTAGTVGKAVIYDGEEAYFQDSNIVWLSNDETIISNRYLYWFCMSMPWVLPSRVTLKHLHNYMIEDTDISVPSLDEQERIIEQFQLLYGRINEIIVKLEQEIDARQKQYEYYREKLLTFKEVV